MCTPCEPSFYSPGGAIKGAVCPTGSYSTLNGTSSCLSCATEGLLCSEGRAYLQPGYWMSRGSDGAMRTYPCAPGFCEGSSIATHESIVCSSLRDPESPLCGACISPYVDWQGECARNDGAIVSLVFTVFGNTALMHLLSQGEPGETTILLFWIQVSSFISGPTVKGMNWQHVFSFAPEQLTSPAGCTFLMEPAFVPVYNIVILLLFPLCLVALGVVLLGAQRVWVAVHGCRGKRGAAIPEVVFMGLNVFVPSVAAFRRTLFAIALYSYGTISETAVSYLRCVSVDSRSIVFALPWISCEGADYASARSFMIAMIIIVVVGFPCGIFWLLRGFDTRVDSHGYPLPSAFRYNTKHFGKYKYLWESQAPSGAAWQAVILIRQMMLVAVSVGLGLFQRAKNMSFGLLFIFFLILHAWKQPYLPVDDFALIHFNVLESFGLTCLLVLSLVIAAYPPPYSDQIQDTLFVMMLVPSLLLGSYLIINRVSTKREQTAQKQFKRAEEKHLLDTEKRIEKEQLQPADTETSELIKPNTHNEGTADNAPDALPADRLVAALAGPLSPSGADVTPSSPSGHFKYQSPFPASPSVRDNHAPPTSSPLRALQTASVGGSSDSAVETAGSAIELADLRRTPVVSADAPASSAIAVQSDSQAAGGVISLAIDATDREDTGPESTEAKSSAAASPTDLDAQVAAGDLDDDTDAELPELDADAPPEELLAALESRRLHQLRQDRDGIVMDDATKRVAHALECAELKAPHGVGPSDALVLSAIHRLLSLPIDCCVRQQTPSLSIVPREGRLWLELHPSVSRLNLVFEEWQERSEFTLSYFALSDVISAETGLPPMVARQRKAGISSDDHQCFTIRPTRKAQARRTAWFVECTGSRDGAESAARQWTAGLSAILEWKRCAPLDKQQQCWQQAIDITLEAAQQKQMQAKNSDEQAQTQRAEPAPALRTPSAGAAEQTPAADEPLGGR